MNTQVPYKSFVGWFFGANRKLPQQTTKGYDQAPSRKALIGDRASTDQASRLLVSRTPGSRNVEMARCSLLRDFAFHEIWMQRISLLLRIPGHRKTEILVPFSFRDFALHEIEMQRVSLSFGVPSLRKAEMTIASSLFGISHFTKSRCKGCLCPLEVLVAEKPKSRNDGSQNIPAQLPSGFRISRNLGAM
jgi:hypothetical protein